MTSENRKVGDRIGLERAAEILAGGKGHGALIAARQLIEDAARLNAISIVGDQEYGGIWQREIVPAQDSQDVIFVWPVAGENVAAEPIDPSLGLSRYRNLTMTDADVEKLAAVFDEWLATSKNERADLACRWWTNPSRNLLQLPAEDDRFPLSLWAVEFGLVIQIAQHQEIPPHAALTVLGNTLKEMIRTRVMADDDRKFLARVALMPRTDATLIRLRLLVQDIMSAELTGSPESRLRVLRLFDPDLSDVGQAAAALEEAARTAIFAPDKVTKPMPETDSALGRGGDTANGKGKSGPRPPTARDGVIRQRLLRGEIPGRNMPWRQFCDAVRDDAGGWKDKRNGKLNRGFDDKTIKNVVEKIRDNPAGHRRGRI